MPSHSTGSRRPRLEAVDNCVSVRGVAAAALAAAVGAAAGARAVGARVPTWGATLLGTPDAHPGGESIQLRSVISTTSPPSTHSQTSSSFQLGLNWKDVAVPDST